MNKHGDTWKYKVISFRYGEKCVDRFATLREAENYFERDTDDCFIDELQDRDGNVVKDNKANVIGWKG